MGPNMKETEDVSENTLEGKLTAINTLATDFERRITGWVQTGKGTKWVYTGEVMVGANTASRLSGLLQSFGNPANLISDKKDDRVAWQKYETIHTMIASLLLDIGCPEDKMTVVIKMFKNTLKNILDIITSSKVMFKNKFGTEEEEKKPGEF